MTFVRDRVTPENLGALLGEHLSAGDLLIDLAWNIDCCEIVQWCHDRGVLYVNTSVELWDPYDGADNKHPTERTLYWRHMKLRRMIASWSGAGADGGARARGQPGPDQPFHQAGACWTSPGRPWRTRSSAALRRRRSRTTPRRRSSTTWPTSSASRSFTAASATRRSPIGPKRSNEFVNTWSVEGFREEGTTTAEMGWGTHEKELPALRLRAPGRPQEPDLPGAHGHQHVRGELGAAGPPHRRHGRPPRRGVHALPRSSPSGKTARRSTGRRSTTRIVRATAPSRRSTSCAAATTSCSRASAS